MSYDINSQQVDIENLFKQNENDLCSIKELYIRLKELEKKIIQIKYIDDNLSDKLKKDYESLKRIILDENIQVKLNNDINEINSQLDNNTKQLNDFTLTFEMFGAKGIDKDYVGDYSDVPDDTEALQKALNYSKLYRYRIKGNGQKRYAISSPLIVSGKCFIDLSGSEIIAISPMDYMLGGILSSENSNNYPTLNNIRFNGNNLVKDVLKFDNLNRVYATNLFFERFKENAINILNGGGFYFSHSYIWGGKYNSTVGLRINASDCMISHIMLRDCNRAIINSRSANVYDDVHGWVESVEVLPNSTFFTHQNVENSDCRLLNCYSDTYQVSFKISTPKNRIVFNTCYTFFNETKFNQETMPNVEPILLQLGSHLPIDREQYTKDLNFNNCVFRPLTYGKSNFIGVTDKSFYGKVSCNFFGNEELKVWEGYPEDTYKTEIENGDFTVNDTTITNHSLSVKKKINRVNLNGFVSRTTLNDGSGAIYGKIETGFTPNNDLIYYAMFVGDNNINGVCQVTIFKSGTIRIDNISGVVMTNAKISLNVSYDCN